VVKCRFGEYDEKREWKERVEYGRIQRILLYKPVKSASEMIICKIEWYKQMEKSSSSLQIVSKGKQFQKFMGNFIFASAILPLNVMLWPYVTPTKGQSNLRFVIERTRWE